MSTAAIEVTVAIVTLVLSVGVSIAVTSFRMGRWAQRIGVLEVKVTSHDQELRVLDGLKDGLTGLVKDVAEIKGMFVLRLRE